MLFRTLTIVGVGLIGGSIGLAAKKRGLVQRVVGVDRDTDKLEQARRLAAIDDGTLDLLVGARDADLIVFCTPVDRIAEQIKLVAQHCVAGAILSDVGSTKGDIVRTVCDDLPHRTCFLGGHPLAGSEKSGVEHAEADLFVDRWTVLTPTAKTPAQVIDSIRGFWQALGSKVRIMSAVDHDQALAMTSHLPHLLAAALAGILPDNLHELTATGFRDTTRVAGGDPAIWTPILLQNSEAIRFVLTALIQRLGKFELALARNNIAAIEELLAQGKKVRDALGS